MRAHRCFALLTLAASFSAAAFAQISITAPPSTSFWGGPFENPPSGATAYAQTFQTPDAVNTQLDSFAFYLVGGSGVDFNAYVMDWDAGTNHPTGAPLWSSPLQSAGSLSTFTRFGVETGGLVLDAGTTYSLVFLAKQSASGSMSNVGSVPTDYYADGFYTQMWGPTIASIGDIGTLSSYSSPAGRDLAFDATFSTPLPAVPEPATAGGFLIVVFVAIAAFLRLRQQRVSAATSSRAPAVPSA